MPRMPDIGTSVRTELLAALRSKKNGWKSRNPFYRVQRSKTGSELACYSTYHGGDLDEGFTIP
jgi:hypothetical protein